MACPADLALLRHTLATLGYRAAKALRNAPSDFGDFRLGEGTRTPLEIVGHLGDLCDWAVHLADGRHVWKEEAPPSWEAGTTRFFAALERLDARLAAGLLSDATAELLFQGPIADALTHVGQISLLRRRAGAPVRGENYLKADIRAGRVGSSQPESKVEFD
ncbi:MAG: hypothetical protein HOP28_16710 [Gemmatimonadales bacterium]|nr:hypothetical protein [Gemmatimonadales bacterium]